MGFNKNGITTITYESDSLNNIIDTIYAKIPLSDSLRIYQAKNIFVLNYPNKVYNWEIIAFKPQANGDIYTYKVIDPKFFALDRNLKLLNAIYYVDGEEKIVNTLNSNYNDQLEFRSATFTGQMKFKTLKKMTSDKNLMSILRKDGTIYIPSDTHE